MHDLTENEYNIDNFVECNENTTPAGFRLMGRFLGCTFSTGIPNVQVCNFMNTAKCHK